jgi:anti-sigma B factor antagonist
MSVYFVDTAVYDDRCDLIVRGQIDLSSADEVAALGSLGLTEPQVRTLVVRLKGVTFIDSTGIGALVRLRNIAFEFDKRLILSEPADRVMRLLEITGLDKVFTIDQSPDQPSSDDAPASYPVFARPVGAAGTEAAPADASIGGGSAPAL